MNTVTKSKSNKMKKRMFTSLAAAALLAASSLSASAQGGARPAFQKGDNTLGFSLGVGPVHKYYGGSSYLPAFIVNFDHGLVNNVGPGTIGIGGIVGWQGAHYKRGNGQRDNWANFIIGFRGTYHLTILKDKNNKFDPYGGVTLGLRAESYNRNYNNGFGDEYGGVYPVFGPFVGAKYNFTPKFGAFSELGFDFTLIKLGLHVNF